MRIRNCCPRFGLSSWTVTMIGAIVTVASGVLTFQKAIDNMGMDTILLYSGAVVLGKSLSETGAAEMFGSAFAGVLRSTTKGYMI